MVRLGLGCAAAVVVIDQLTKWWMLAALGGPPGIIAITPFFNLVLVENRGISFGLLSSRARWLPWLLVAFALVIGAALIHWLGRVQKRWLAAAIGLVLGGALGNAIDRVVHGAVVDFFDFHLAGFHWPAFNVADSAIVVGVAALLIDGLMGGRERPKKAP